MSDDWKTNDKVAPPHPAIVRQERPEGFEPRYSLRTELSLTGFALTDEQWRDLEIGEDIAVPGPDGEPVPAWTVTEILDWRSGRDARVKPVAGGPREEKPDEHEGL